MLGEEAVGLLNQLLQKRGGVDRAHWNRTVLSPFLNNLKQWEHSVVNPSTRSLTEFADHIVRRLADYMQLQKAVCRTPNGP